MIFKNCNFKVIPLRLKHFSRHQPLVLFLKNLRGFYVSLIRYLSPWLGDRARKEDIICTGRILQTREVGFARKYDKYRLPVISKWSLCLFLSVSVHRWSLILKPIAGSNFLTSSSSSIGLASVAIINFSLTTEFGISFFLTFYFRSKLINIPLH